MANPYGYTTTRYQIPCWQEGNVSSGFYNKRAGDIIDSALEVSMAVVSFNTTYPIAIITEGIFAATFSTGNSSLSVPSLKAILNGVFIESIDAKSVASMVNSQTYFVYASLVETDPVTNSSRARRDWSLSVGTNGITPDDSGLIAKVVTDGSSATVWYLESQLPSINAGNDTNKAYFRGVIDHIRSPTLDHPSLSIFYFHLAHAASISPSQMRALGPSLSDFGATVNPFLGAGSVALPSNLVSEIQSLRYQIGQLSGQANWFIPPPLSLASVAGLGLVTVNPAAVTSFVGVATHAARADHWHPLPAATIIPTHMVLSFGVRTAFISASLGAVSIGLPTAAMMPGHEFILHRIDNNGAGAVVLYPVFPSQLLNDVSLASVGAYLASRRIVASPSHYYY